MEFYYLDTILKSDSEIRNFDWLRTVT